MKNGNWRYYDLKIGIVLRVKRIVACLFLKKHDPLFCQNWENCGKRRISLKSARLKYLQAYIPKYFQTNLASDNISFKFYKESVAVETSPSGLQLKPSEVGCSRNQPKWFSVETRPSRLQFKPAQGGCCGNQPKWVAVETIPRGLQSKSAQVVFS